ncbi:MAG: hypothetical protein JKY69_04920 [Flavobacteriaceae bacterium]|nr:hypothetical protein [Flavobacteriaceae bacterium]
MEEIKKNQKLNAFTKKYLKDLELESPSVDFTANIMDVISVIKTSDNAVTYKPLISKKGWFLVFSILAAILIIPLRGVESKWVTLPELNFSFLEKISFTGLLDGFTISNTVVYTVCLFAVLMTIQLFYLKGYFEKRLSI